MAAIQGVSTVSLLGIVFIILKLTNVINWSWWWVLLPFWGGLALGIVVVILFILGTALIYLVNK